MKYVIQGLNVKERDILGGGGGGGGGGGELYKAYTSRDESIRS